MKTRISMTASNGRVLTVGTGAKTTLLKSSDEFIDAVTAAAAKLGISRSEYLRRAAVAAMLGAVDISSTHTFEQGDAQKYSVEVGVTR